jgi:hypothetical protein
MEADDFMNDDLKTMVSCLNSLIKKGYTEDYKVTERGMKSVQSEKVYSPRDVKEVNFYRFEGNSDPSDNSILYAIETKDGSRGTLADAFGPYADTKVASFMKEVEPEIVNKKV